MNAVKRDLDREDGVKNAFMSVVSHETQTPITIIKESLALIRDEIVGPLTEKQQYLLQIAEDNVMRLSRLIADMSDWVHLQSGDASLQRVNFNLVFLMQQEILKVKRMAETKDIALSFVNENELGPCFISGDAMKLDQVFDHILKNALAYTDPKGVVTVDIQERGCYFRVLIKDSGPGISEQDLAKIFTPLEQFHRTYRPGSQGIGMGLALCKKLVELHGGLIDVNSKVGCGTEIAVTLPKSKGYINV
jgi:signal transduction histidine kinase